MSFDIKVLETMDPEIWNTLYKNSVIKDVIQTYSWAKIMKMGFNSKPIFLIVRNNDKIVGGQVFFLKNYGIMKIIDSKGGPLFIENFEKYVVRNIFDFLKKQNSLVNLNSIKFRSDFNAHRYVSDNSFAINQDATFILNLNEHIEVNLPKKTRYDIRKAQKAGLKIVESKNWLEWEYFFELYVKHGKKKNYGTYPLSFFKGLYDLLLPENHARLYIAKLDEQIIAGALFLLSEEYITYYIGAIKFEYRSRYNPSDLLIWKAIEDATKQFISKFDLGGALVKPSITHELYGVHKYKEKWGGNHIIINVYSIGKLYRVIRAVVEGHPFLKRMYWYFWRG